MEESLITETPLEATQSPSIAKLAAALAQAQGVMQAAKKGSENPFFKSSYADLNSVWEAIREPLSKNGLSVAQLAHSDNGAVGVTTVLMHTSGEWIKGNLSMKPAKPDPQGVGSCLTYARRYALSAIVGVCADEDDDGNAASRPSKPKTSPAGNTYQEKPDTYWSFSRKDGSKVVGARQGKIFTPDGLKDMGFSKSKTDKTAWYAPFNQQLVDLLEACLKEIPNE